VARQYGLEGWSSQGAIYLRIIRNMMSAETIIDYYLLSIYKSSFFVAECVNLNHRF
jgi:hypothetical protein